MEAYIFMGFKHGNSIACPRMFWSALRKVMDIAGIDDLFSKKANLMIDAFAIDKKVKRKRYIPITWIHKIES